METVLIVVTAQAYMKLKSPDTHQKAWDMVKLLEIVR